MRANLDLAVRYLRIKLLDWYYRYGNAVVTDTLFDTLLDAAVSAFEARGVAWPDLPLREFGTGRRSVHVFAMGSVKKLSYREFIAWTTRKEARIEPKLDGVALQVVHAGGETHWYTRGDGTEGSDVSHHFAHYSCHGHRDFIALAEAFVTLSAWKKIVGYSTPRSYVAAIVNSKEPSNNLSVLAYDLLSGGYHPLPRVIGRSVLNEAEAVAQVRRVEVLSQLLPVDGAIAKTTGGRYGLTAGHREDCRAYKFPLGVVYTLVEALTWNTGRQGHVVPTVSLSPCTLEGRVVESVSGHNARFVRDHGIGSGARVGLRMAGQTIPQVVGVVDQVEVTIPRECPNCGGETVFDSVRLLCLNQRCHGRLTSLMEYICSRGCLDMRGVGAESCPVLAQYYPSFFRSLRMEGREEWVFFLPRNSLGKVKKVTAEIAEKRRSWSLYWTLLVMNLESVSNTTAGRIDASFNGKPYAFFYRLRLEGENFLLRLPFLGTDARQGLLSFPGSLFWGYCWAYLGQTPG